MRARFRFEYVSNAETCRKFPRRNRGTRRRPRELTRFGGTHLNASALKRNFAAEGSHGRVSQSSLSSYARSIVTSYLIRAFLSLFFFFFFYFRYHTLLPSLSHAVSLNYCVWKVILLFFNRLPTARICIAISLRLIRALSRLKFSFENYTRASPVRSKSNERRTEAA